MRGKVIFDTPALPSLSISLPELYARLSIRGELREELREELRRAYCALCSVASPSFIGGEEELEYREGVPTLLGTPLSFDGVEKWLKGAKRVKLLTLSLGFGADRLIGSPASGVYSAFVADALASTLAEALADYAQDKLCAGERVGKRFSPGYGGMPQSLSRLIITALGADRRLGISFTEGGLMLPMKTVTAVIPILEDDNAN